MPDRGGAGNARDEIGVHGGVVIVANPNGGQEFGSITDSPVVTQVVGGAGFDGDDLVPDVQQ